MDINHIVNNLHTPNKFPTNISNNNNFITSTNWDKEVNITMDDHHHIHQHHQHHNNHVLPHISLFDQVWPTYHNFPTPHSSQPSIQHPNSSSYIIKSSLQNQILLDEDDHELEEEEELSAMKEMMYRIAVMQPVDIDPSSVRKPKRRNVRISNDPQSVAARHRRERISEKIRILQRLVPGGTKLDTASMLDEAICYVKFLKRQIRQLQAGSSTNHAPPPPVPAVPQSDWAHPPPLAASLMGVSTNLGSSKVEFSREKHHHDEGLLFHNGGN